MTDKKVSDDYIECMYLEGGSIVHANALDVLMDFDVLYEVPYYDRGRDVHIIALAVNLNDVFFWGCADCEFFSHTDVQPLYEMCFDKEGNFNPYGSIIWACLKREMRPQHPLEDRMRRGGYWTDELEALPVRENTG